MIKVWTDGADAGLLDRSGDRGSTFLCQPDSMPARSVSVTMPVRLSSIDVRFGLAPIFEMNLPEGMCKHRGRGSLLRQRAQGICRNWRTDG
jgi:serine/threonine-protein kinase HipA